MFQGAGKNLLLLKLIYLLAKPNWTVVLWSRRNLTETWLLRFWHRQSYAQVPSFHHPLLTSSFPSTSWFFCTCKITISLPLKKGQDTTKGGKSRHDGSKIKKSFFLEENRIKSFQVLLHTAKEQDNHHILCIILPHRSGKTTASYSNYQKDRSLFVDFYWTALQNNNIKVWFSFHGTAF